MKIATQFINLSRFLNAFNNKAMHVKKITDNDNKDPFWDKECLEHPTNNSCLIYCD